MGPCKATGRRAMHRVGPLPAPHPACQPSKLKAVRPTLRAGSAAEADARSPSVQYKPGRRWASWVFSADLSRSGEPVTLAPGGYHIMLMGLKQTLKQGDSFPVTLGFAKAGQVTATATVEKAGAAMPGLDHSNMGDLPMQGSARQP